VEVLWHDAHGGDIDWTPLRKTHRGPEKIRTVGILDSDDKKGVTVALSNDTRRNVDCYIFIPRASITNVRRLR
jgi:hypothetical protein